jgi:hypothetical protein
MSRVNFGQDDIIVLKTSRPRSLASRNKDGRKRKGSDFKQIKANLESLVKDLECDQLLIDDETLYSGEATSGGSDFRCKQSRQLLSPIAVDSLMTTPEFK